MQRWSRRREGVFTGIARADDIRVNYDNTCSISNCRWVATDAYRYATMAW